MGRRGGKQSQLSGLMGSTFTALDSEVQNGKEKGEGRALSAQAGKPSLGPASQSKRPLCFLPPHPAGTWLGGDLAKAPVLSLASTAELGQLVSSSITGSRERSCASLQCNGHQGKLLEWDLGVCGMGCCGFRVCRAGFKGSFTVPGGELSPHSMENMGIGAEPREGAAQGTRAPRKRRGKPCRIPRRTNP